MEQTELYFLMQNIATFIVLGIFGIFILFIIVICLIDNIKDKFKKWRTKSK